MDNELKILEHRFNMEEYQKFCMQFLNLSKDQLLLLKEQKINYPVYRDYVYSYYKIADYIDNDGKAMMVLAIKLIDSKLAERARSMQRNLVARLLEDFNIDAALVGFYSGEESSWRLSFVGLDYEFTAKGLNKKLTPARRYSYLVGENEPNHTAREQLKNIYIDDKNNPTIKEIEEAFKIEKVTKRFFDEYKDKYLKLKEFLDDDDNFKYESERLGFTSEEFSKKLMGQLAFLYFIQKKGWLGVKAVPHEMKYSEYVKIHDKQNETVRNILSKVFSRDNANMKLSYNAIRNLTDIEGDYLAGVFTNYVDENEADWGQWGSGNKKFITELFNICMKSKTKKNFFNDYLEPLFYSALNTKRGANEYFKLFNCKIPFLNGGLFESIYGHEDKKSNIKIPNEIFSNKSEVDEFGSGILDIFSTYNFTMNEDEPLEKEVAIDPEMLGKIFENLLDIKDRKSKGAFYTPREIVHHMCQESLINYLHNETGIYKEDIENFVRLGDFIVDEDSRALIGSKDKNQYLIPISIYDNINAIDTALKSVRVADPAVGSGAFPLGMLNEIVRLRSYLTLYMTQGLNKDDKLDLERRRSNYTLKEEIMKYVIHAVDIERSAVDITKLRLWLSLIVDADIHTINALPNLDGNIKCGNSLIDEFEGIKLFDESLIMNNGDSDKLSGTQLMIHEDKEKKLLDTLEILQKELFDAKEPEKKIEKKELIDKIEWELIEYKLKKDGNEDKIEKFKFLKTEQRKPYFIWNMEFSDVFREKGGFDIVIGNPPYIGEKGNKEIFHDIKNTGFGKMFYQRRMDIFYFFIAKGIELLKSKGTISFITTNYWITASGGQEKFRPYLKNTVNILKYVDFGEYKIFDSALGQHNSIFLFEKNLNEKNRKANVIKIDDYNRAKDYSLNEILSDEMTLDGILKFNSQGQNEIYDEKTYNIHFNNNIVFDIIEKIQKNGEILLGELCTISGGVSSSADKVRNANLKHCSLDEQQMGKINIGDGILVLDYDEVTKLDFSNTEMMYIKPYFKSSEIEKYMTNNSPSKYLVYATHNNAYEILQQEKIYRHLCKYKSILENRSQDIELERAMEKGYWFVLTNGRNRIDFSQPKIVCPYRTKDNVFGYNEVEWYAGRDVYYLVDVKINIKFLLGLLNSKFIKFWLEYKGKRKGDIYEIYPEPLKNIPIVYSDNETIQKIAFATDEILAIVNEEQKYYGNTREKELTKIQEQINDYVYNLYNLSQEEVKFINEL